MNRMSGGPEPHGLLHGLAEVCVVCLCRMTLCKTIPNTFIFCIVCKPSPGMFGIETGSHQLANLQGKW
jgi:hypothetical protein